MLKVFTFLSVLLSIASLSYAQNQEATIKIEKSENGEVVIIEKKIELNDGQDINSILQELGVLDELGNLKEGQSFEINVKKKDGINVDEDIRIEYFDIPELNWGFESRAFLGVMLKENTSEDGVLISSIIEETQAANSDLMPGDVIKTFNGVSYSTVHELVEAIGALKPGETVEIEYLRDGKIYVEKVELGEKKVTPFEQRQYEFNFPGQFPNEQMDENFGRLFEFHLDEDGNPTESLMPEEETAFLGVSPGFGFTDEDKGVLIGSVTAESAAEQMGIQPGDFILSINKTEVNTFIELSSLIKSLNKGDEVKIELSRDGKRVKVKGELGGRSIKGFNGKDMFGGFPNAEPFNGTPREREFFFRYDGDENSIPLEGLEQQLEEMMLELESMGDDFDPEQFELQLQEMLVPLLEDLEMNVTEEINLSISVESVSKEDLEMVNQNAPVKLSIDDDLDMQFISFFPNPTSGEFNLNFNLASEEPYRVLVFNQLGKTVFEDNRNISGEYSGAIDLSQLANGPYYLVITQGGSSYNRKIIKE